MYLPAAGQQWAPCLWAARRHLVRRLASPQVHRLVCRWAHHPALQRARQARHQVFGRLALPRLDCACRTTMCSAETCMPHSPRAHFMFKRFSSMSPNQADPGDCVTTVTEGGPRWTGFSTLDEPSIPCSSVGPCCASTSALLRPVYVSPRLRRSTTQKPRVRRPSVSI